MCSEKAVLKRPSGSSPPGPLCHLLSARALAALAFALTLLALAPEARAALTIANNVRRDNPHDLTQTKFWISKADCENDEAYYFPIKADVATGTLEIWVSSNNSANCTMQTDRSGVQQKCYQVSSPQAGTISNANSFDVVLKAGDIAKALPEVDDTCFDSTAADLPRPIVLWFLQITPGVDPVDSFVKSTDTQGLDISIDLVAPEPPNVTGMEVGEESVLIQFEKASQTTQKQLRKYIAFCDPPSGNAAAGGCDCIKGAGSTGNGSGTGTDTNTDTTTTTTTTTAAPPPPPQGMAGTAGTGGTAGTSGTAGTAGSAGTGGAESCATEPAIDACQSCYFKEGEEAPSEKGEYYCGEDATVANGQVKVDGLRNGTTYAVAVAAVDKVGNVSKLSKLECNAPAETSDFYESYRGRGGKAGGGTCAMRPWVRESSTLAPLGAGAVLLALGARRLARRKHVARGGEK
jgi:hypothetical protein